MPTLHELNQIHTAAWTRLVYALAVACPIGSVVTFKSGAMLGPQVIQGRVLEVVTAIDRRRCDPHLRVVDDLTGREYTVAVWQLAPEWQEGETAQFVPPPEAQLRDD